ncbi:FmdB family zinc ribbon protein [Treponema primitia]|uniref:FmdB family zinc ribbon protein n=1 Tax=Treponema primitia TaxID=88058 RepID=UPI0002555492|nr:FmdB family zinc ribbon protein [Treponema primitia]
MPTYEYECKSCGHSFEIIQSMKDDPLKICPQCGKEVRRVINGGGGIIFKGSGFYVTDNSKRSGGSSSSKPAAKPSESACAGCAKAESGCAGNSVASSAGNSAANAQAVNS